MMGLYRDTLHGIELLRYDKVFELLRWLNEHEGDDGGLFDCELLGLCRIWWGKHGWEWEWTETRRDPTDG